MPSYQTYADYRSSGVNSLGPIPSHWKTLALHYVGRLKSGESITSLHFIENGEYPVYGGNGFRGNYDRFTHDGDHVLIGRQGALCGNINIARGRFFASEHAIVVNPDREFNTNWLGYQLLSMNLNQYSFSAAQPGLSSEVIGRLKIAFPPLEEQQAIARFLDFKTAQIDTLIAKQQTLLDKLAEKRTALISHTVTKGLDPSAPMKNSGVTWLGEIPNHWKSKRLKFVIGEPLKYGANEAAELTDPDLPRYIRITDVKDDGSLRDETFRSLPQDVANSYLLSDGDILLARSGATVGKSFIYKPSWGVAAYAGYLIKARMSDMMEADFAYLFLQSSCYWQWLNSIFIQATIQNVSAEKYANLIIPVPPVNEQSAIVSDLLTKLEKIDSQRAKVNLVVDRLIEYRSAVITNTITGKIDVRGFTVPQPADRMAA